MVSKDGVATDPAKMEKVANWLIPSRYGELLQEICEIFCIHSQATAPAGGEEQRVCMDTAMSGSI